MYKIVVTEINPLADLGAPAVEVRRFEQTVDELNLRAVITAVNQKPRAPRKPKEAKK
jgi:hypothetical protein